jgi:hypothetical protein
MNNFLKIIILVIFTNKLHAQENYSTIIDLTTVLPVDLSNDSLSTNNNSNNSMFYTKPSIINIIHLNQLLSSIFLIIVTIEMVYLINIYYCNYKTTCCLCKKLKTFFTKTTIITSTTKRRSIKSLNINLFGFYFKYLFTFSIIIIIFLIIRLIIYLLNDSNLVFQMMDRNSTAVEFLFNLKILKFNNFILNYLHCITNLPFLALLSYLNLQFLTKISHKNFIKLVKTSSLNYNYHYYRPNTNKKKINIIKKVFSIAKRIILLNNSTILSIIFIYLTPVITVLLLNMYLNLNISLLNYNFDQKKLFLALFSSVLTILIIIQASCFVIIIRIFLKIHKINSFNVSKNGQTYKLVNKSSKFNDLGKITSSSKYSKYYYDNNNDVANVDSDNQCLDYVLIDDDLINLNKRFCIILKKSLIFLLISILFTVAYLVNDLIKLINDNSNGFVGKILTEKFILNIDLIKLCIEYCVYFFQLLFLISFLISFVKFFHHYLFKHVSDSDDDYDDDGVEKAVGKKNKNEVGNLNFNENSHLIRKLSNSGINNLNNNNNICLRISNNEGLNGETLEIRRNSIEVVENENDDNDLYGNTTVPGMYYGRENEIDGNKNYFFENMNNNNNILLTALSNSSSGFSTFKRDVKESGISKIGDTAVSKIVDSSKDLKDNNEDPAYSTTNILFPDVKSF